MYFIYLASQICLLHHKFELSQTQTRMYTSIYTSREEIEIHPRDSFNLYLSVAKGVGETIKHLEEAEKFRVKPDADTRRIDFRAAAAIYIREGQNV